MNEHSSRSHAIFTLLLEQRIVGSSDGGENADPNVGSSVRFLTAKFHLVDLAGGFCRAVAECRGHRGWWSGNEGWNAVIMGSGDVL